MRIELPIPENAQNDLYAYLQLLKMRLAADTLISQRRILAHYVRWCDAHALDYRTIARGDIERYLLSRAVKNSTRRKKLTALQGFYCRLDVAADPTQGITLGKDAARRLPCVPTQRTVEAIFGHATQMKHREAIRDLLMLEMGYGSGLRRKELRLLDIEDIDLAGMTARVMGKGSKARIVPITRRVAALLPRYLLERPYRFRRSNGPLFIDYWTGRRLTRETIARTVKRISGYTPHAFRHAAATHMLENGCGVRHIQELLGHASISTTTIYTRIDKSGLARVVQEKHPRTQACCPARLPQDCPTVRRFDIDPVRTRLWSRQTHPPTENG
jgi:site-specific recombinase XerD